MCFLLAGAPPSPYLLLVSTHRPLPGSSQTCALQAPQAALPTSVPATHSSLLSSWTTGMRPRSLVYFSASHPPLTVLAEEAGLVSGALDLALASPLPCASPQPLYSPCRLLLQRGAGGEVRVAVCISTWGFEPRRLPPLEVRPSSVAPDPAESRAQSRTRLK